VFLSGVEHLIPWLGRIPLESFGVDRTQDIPLRASGRAGSGAVSSSSAAVNFKTNLAVRFENSSTWPIIKAMLDNFHNTEDSWSLSLNERSQRPLSPYIEVVQSYLSDNWATSSCRSTPSLRNFRLDDRMIRGCLCNTKNEELEDRETEKALQWLGVEWDSLAKILRQTDPEIYLY